MQADKKPLGIQGLDTFLAKSPEFGTETRKNTIDFEPSEIDRKDFLICGLVFSEPWACCCFACSRGKEGGSLPREEVLNSHSSLAGDNFC